MSRREDTEGIIITSHRYHMHTGMNMIRINKQERQRIRIRIYTCDRNVAGEDTLRRARIDPVHAHASIDIDHYSSWSDKRLYNCNARSLPLPLLRRLDGLDTSAWAKASRRCSLSLTGMDLPQQLQSQHPLCSGRGAERWSSGMSFHLSNTCTSGMKHITKNACTCSRLLECQHCESTVTSEFEYGMNMKNRWMI